MGHGWRLGGSFGEGRGDRGGQGWGLRQARGEGGGQVEWGGKWGASGGPEGGKGKTQHLLQWGHTSAFT